VTLNKEIGLDDDCFVIVKFLYRLQKRWYEFIDFNGYNSQVKIENSKIGRV